MNPPSIAPAAAADERFPSAFSGPLPVPPPSLALTQPRAAGRRTPIIYPFLLLTSTAVAGLFCYLYLTKPVITPAAWLPEVKAIPPAAIPPVAVAPPAVEPPPVAIAPPVAPPATLLPNAKVLPGDPPVAAPASRPEPADPRHAIPASASAFEETNLRIQHVLTAETPGGDISRIVLEVPVLYQTGTLAWTQSEVAESRELLKRLADYQEKSRALRDEGSRLLTAWNQLVERSIPGPVLRADSPALPANQTPEVVEPPAPTLDTTESIQLQPAGK